MRDKSILLGLFLLSITIILNLASFYLDLYYQWEFLMPLLITQSIIVVFMGLNLARKPKQNPITQPTHYVKQENQTQPFNSKKDGICPKCKLPLDLCLCPKNIAEKKDENPSQETDGFHLEL